MTEGATRAATRGWGALFWLLLTASAYVLFAPGSSAPGLFPRADLLVHLALFASLAGVGRRAAWGNGRLAAGLAAYAVASEVIQGSPLVSDRAASVADLVADGAGIALGLALAAALGRRSGASGPARRRSAR